MCWVYYASEEVCAKSTYRSIITVCVVLTVLMVLIVLARVAIRFEQHRIAADDYLSLAGMIFCIIYNSLSIVQTRYGMGLPMVLRPEKTVATYTKLNFAGRPFYQLGIFFFKGALCISYLRLLSGTSKKWYRSTIWTVGILIALGHVAAMLIVIFNCDPVRNAWDPVSHGHCLVNGFTTTYILSGFSIACDLIVIILPIPLLLELNIPCAQKVGVICLFLLGLFTTVCSVLRMTQISDVIKGHGESTTLVLWGSIEFNIGNIMSSLPFLTPIFKRPISMFGFLMCDKKSNVRPRCQYVMQTCSKDAVNISTEDAPTVTAMPKMSRTPSEELILDENEFEDGEIRITRTINYRVTVDEDDDTLNDHAQHA